MNGGPTLHKAKMKLGKGKVNCSLGAGNVNVDNSFSSDDSNVFLKEGRSSRKSKVVPPGITSADLSKVLNMFGVFVTGNVMYDSSFKSIPFHVNGFGNRSPHTITISNNIKGEGF